MHCVSKFSRGTGTTPSDASMGNYNNSHLPKISSIAPISCYKIEVIPSPLLNCELTFVFRELLLILEETKQKDSLTLT